MYITLKSWHLSSSHSAPTSHVLNVASTSSNMRSLIVLRKEREGAGLHLCPSDSLRTNLKKDKKKKKENSLWKFFMKRILHENGVSKHRLLLFSGKMLKAGSTIRDFMTIRHEKNVAAFSWKGDGGNRKERERRHSCPRPGGEESEVHCEGNVASVTGWCYVTLSTCTLTERDGSGITHVTLTHPAEIYSNA